LANLSHPLFGIGAATAIVYGVFAALTLTAVLFWQVFGRGPRRRRGLERAEGRLAAGTWQDALHRVRKLRNLGRLSAVWTKRFDDLEARCLGRAAQAALENKRYEDALGHLLHKAQLAGQPDTEAKNAVQAVMLEEIRRVFSLTSLVPGEKASAESSNSQPIHDLIARTLLVASPCREASFWQALCFLRNGAEDPAMAALETARTGVGADLLWPEKTKDAPATNGEPRATSDAGARGAGFVDPPLYLGALLLRQGRARDSLKYLTEANRLAANCPIVTLQLARAMIEAGGDAQVAVRALQRALGPRGLETWAQEPQRAWVEGLPEGRSYIRNLAAIHRFVCPIWGADLAILMQQGNLALAQGLYKLAAYPEAAELFAKVLQNGAPSLTVLRGLGLALARQGKYDEAFKHLRIAHEMEEPKDRVTAGYLALCGAKGTPTQPEDKARNIRWALNLVSQFNAPGDREWVALVNGLFTDARQESLPLSLDDQLYLCEHLWSVHATDPDAALAYEHMERTYPQGLRPEYAWLYCRASQEHKLRAPPAQKLFERTFGDPEPARAFFAAKAWDWAELEMAYLEQAAAVAPGQFPAVLGPAYPAVGEKRLLERSQKQEDAGDAEDALATAEALYRLAPHSARACDRLAFLYHRAGHDEQALELLETWCHRDPSDPCPQVRLAVLLHQRGLASASQTRLRTALSLCDGPRRARIAFLGARLALQQALGRGGHENNGAPSAKNEALLAAEEFLHACLRDDPDHADAPWCLAAVRWLCGVKSELTPQDAAASPAILDRRQQFFAALCRLAAGDFAGTLAMVARDSTTLSPTPETGLRDSAAKPQALEWSVEISYLVGLAHLGLGQHEEACRALERPALSTNSPSAAHAQALLGAVHLIGNDHASAARWWQNLDSKKRAAWSLGEALAHTVFLSGLEAYVGGQFEEAGEKLRAAGKLGCRDRRLGPLLVTALFKAGQAMVYPP
jgi:tetratricopeptide (TPR) repeat protein